jgi:hypothetical protein
MVNEMFRTIAVLDVFKDHFDKTFIKRFLMHKNSYTQNILVCNFQSQHSDSSNFDNLIKLFTLIFTIFDKDFELFEDLLMSKDYYGTCLIKKLHEQYKNETEKLNKIKNWIKENLGNDFLKKLESNENFENAGYFFEFWKKT